MGPRIGDLKRRRTIWVCGYRRRPREACPGWQARGAGGLACCYLPFYWVVQGVADDWVTRRPPGCGKRGREVEEEEEEG